MTKKYMVTLYDCEGELITNKVIEDTRAGIVQAVCDMMKRKAAYRAEVYKASGRIDMIVRRDGDVYAIDRG